MIVLILISLYIMYVIYDHIYYNSQSFKVLKQRVSEYISDCNELNQHIEELKNTELVINKKDYGNALYHDTSKWKYQRKHLKLQAGTPYVYNCSRTICSNAQKKPFDYLCKYFGIEFTEETLSIFEEILNNFEAVEEGKNNLLAEKEQLLKSVQTEIPRLIKVLGSKERLAKKLGFEEVDMSTTYFPRYIFQYISSGGNASMRCEIVMDIKNLNRFVIYLSEKIKFRKSIKGQRSLMTSKLRQYIKERDSYTCKKCGISVNQEPHLLLEIDHIIPIAKGGLTTEENLQTLCWRCNRKKGTKLGEEIKQI